MLPSRAVSDPVDEHAALRDELGELERERERLHTTPHSLAELRAYSLRLQAFHVRLDAYLKRLQLQR